MNNPKENNKPDSGNDEDFPGMPKGPKKQKFNFYWIYLILAFVILFVLFCHILPASLRNGKILKTNTSLPTWSINLSSSRGREK